VNERAVAGSDETRGELNDMLNSETILLVEDQPALRDVVRESLETFGYRVVEAADGEQAMAMAMTAEEPLQLLLSDVVMPAMGGRELADALRKARPNLPVLFMSGYTEGAVSRHGVLEGGTAFISKPFTPRDLARKVRETLDATA
jgi:two-component system, cell cycle sensor histidine kinase and response regulator CckA